MELIIQNKKKLILIGLVVALVALGGVFSYFYFFSSQSEPRDENNQVADEVADEVETLPQREATVIVFNGAVKSGLQYEDWALIEEKEVLSKDKILSTGDDSDAVIQFPSNDLLILGANTQIKILSITDEAILIEQVAGTTYSVVEKKAGKTYTIRKGDAEITALGTEFLVDSSQGNGETSVYAFQSEVLLKYQGQEWQVPENQKAVLSSANTDVALYLITASEDDLKQPFAVLSKEARGQPVEEASVEPVEESSEEVISTDALVASETEDATESAASGEEVASEDIPEDIPEEETPDTSDDTSSSDPPSIPATPDPEPPPSVPETPTTPHIGGDYSAASVESIVNALPLVYNDALGDYLTPPGGGPPQGVYPYAPIDQDNLYMGISGGRLYIRITLGGALPTQQETIGSDRMLSVIYNLGIDNDGMIDGDTCAGSETSLQMRIGYNDDNWIWYVPWFSANCLSGGGGHDNTYEATGSGLAHTYNAGLGKTSVVFSYALADLLGTVNQGDALQISIASEAESSNWEHYSYDQNFSLWTAWTAAGI